MAKSLRTQFMNHMILHRFSHYTIKNYMSAVEKLAKYHNKSPDKLTNGDIQNYLLYLIGERKLTGGTCNVHMSGISCFYKNILQWDETDFKLPPSPRIKKLPNILSVEEVKRLFECAANLKHRVLLKTVYSAGLRISEAVKLKPIHIESDPSRMMIRIEQGKGKKDRYTVLSKYLLDELRLYWQEYKPGKWIFPGQNKENHIGFSGAREAFLIAKKKPV
ncbi:site-specific integrase [Desulfotignum balticum]|jgi:site-specific recombinase XerD|uniref:site-specific integrase n=1 Tax=Desulfotignum balticum TaxID=115781 RepID=UPI00068797BB|nr:phage integrase N-terminal SAM-like domain-containing protein [Desulfotignum balticum]